MTRTTIESALLCLLLAAPPCAAVAITPAALGAAASATPVVPRAAEAEPPPAASQGSPAPATPGSPSAEPGETLTLDRALAIALENNRDLRNEALEAEKSGDQVAESRTRLFPVTDLTLLGSRMLSRIEYEFPKGSLGTLPGIGPVPDEDTTFRSENRFTTFVSASVMQPVTQLYKAGLGLRLSKAALEAQRERQREARQSVTNGVKRLYHSILESQSALAASEETLASYAELERVVRENVSHETALAGDAMDVEARLENEKYHELGLRHSLASQKEQLNDLMGRDISVDFSVSESPDRAPFETDLEAARSLALARRPEIREADLSVQQADLDRRMKGSEFIPDLSFGYGYLSPYNIDVLPKNLSSIRVLLSWEPFDWGRRSRELASKRRAVEQAKNAREGARSKVLMEVGAGFRRLEESRMLVEVSRIAEEASREKSRIAMERYRQQAALLKDVLLAQSDLAEASHRHHQAVLGLWVAQADFQKSIGEE